MEENKMESGSNFIHDFIDGDLKDGVYDHVQTRFPPEPNGYLHIGHAKAICINFTTAMKYGGKCNLRLDDTNPIKEDTEYVDAILEDIKWLGFQWDHLYYASDYFDFIYECAVRLIELGKAYVDDLTADEIRAYRGTLTEPGKESPYRNRSVEENLDLFRRMTAGEFQNGARVLRAKIDMGSPNLNMRDPVIYRIAHVSHHRTGDKWCVYPMYDFAHPLSDAKEGVTHSLCSLEFENHRPLYNWFLQELGFEHPPRQIEFARLNLNYCVTSKRKCLALVKDGLVSGWNDPRMATLSGMRRRGYPAAAIRDFCERIGVSKAYSVVDYGLLESCVRDRLNADAPRAMAVLRPLKVIIDNYPEGQTETIEVENNPDRPELGTRKVTFSRELYVEQDDFMAEPVKKYFRLFPGNEVRLKSAYFVTCTGYETDDDGRVTCLHCTYDPDSKGGNSPDGRKVKGTLHWVSAADSVKAEVRLYDRLFRSENPADTEAFEENINPDSLVTLTDCRLEGSLKGAKAGDTFQFMRQGYFCVDPDSTSELPVFNRTVALNSSWEKKK
ncbi:MAG: glutamine--tRNA ligase/YqeY domain fusion protein [Candidatus Fimivicinus sp.]|nr:glutamine--tRNA ligase/YqeY domain fusion protein [Oscillospiraceae bacterium]MDY5590418.1 glutamine--tRNA ligase/YqeY domain fusion protein [Candidatus Fimivicinus sp.]